MRKILILEDALIGGLTQAALAERGYEASWFIGAREIKDGMLNGIRPDFSKETVALADYCLAFVDGFLSIEGLMGWELLPELDRHMIAISTSSIGDIGTARQIEKEEMLLNLDKRLAPLHPDDLQSAASY